VTRGVPFLPPMLLLVAAHLRHMYLYLSRLPDRAALLVPLATVPLRAPRC
jgi:hypothetical protein